MNGQRFVYSTTVKIHPKYWDDVIQRPINIRLIQLRKAVKSNHSLVPEKERLEKILKHGEKINQNILNELDDINTQINRISDGFDKAYSYLIKQNITPTPYELKELLDRGLKRKIEESDTPVKFFDVFDEFLESMKDSHSTLTIKKFKTLKTDLIHFENKGKYRITFETIDMIFYDKYKRYLLRKKTSKYNASGLVNDTISKYISCIKTFMQWSLDRNYHNNKTFQNNQFAAKKKAKNEIVTLTEEELQKILNLDLSGNLKLERVRDLFCFATFTGQRWSDIINYKKKNLHDTYWNFESYKTKEKIKIPLIGFATPALNILRKYNYELPKISVQKFNNYIKEVGKLAGIDKEIVIKRYSGKKQIEIKKPKFEYMASHMARRTCVTLLLQHGVPPTTIMKLTGHTDLKTLMKYENTHDDALSEALEKVNISII